MIAEIYASRVCLFFFRMFGNRNRDDAATCMCGVPRAGSVFSPRKNGLVHFCVHVSTFMSRPCRAELPLYNDSH